MKNLFKTFTTLVIGLVLSGCAALFPGLTTGSVVADLDAYITVANDVSSWSADAWALVPASAQASALVAYTDAQGALKTSIQVAEDAVAAYEAAGTQPNVPAIIASVDAAVDALIAEVESLAASTSSARLGVVGAPRSVSSEFAGKVALLEKAKTTIHRHKNPRPAATPAPTL
jgi:hypothetical protein